VIAELTDIDVIEGTSSKTTHHILKRSEVTMEPGLEPSPPSQNVDLLAGFVELRQVANMAIRAQERRRISSACQSRHGRHETVTRQLHRGRCWSPSLKRSVSSFSGQIFSSAT